MNMKYDELVVEIMEEVEANIASWFIKEQKKEEYAWKQDNGFFD